MPDHSNGDSDNAGENSGDGHQNQQHPTPAEPAETPQQPGPQHQPNPGPDEGDQGVEPIDKEDEEEEEEDDGSGGEEGQETDPMEEEEEMEDGELAAMTAAGNNVRHELGGGQDSTGELADHIRTLVQGNFDHDFEFLAQYNFLLLGGLPPDLAEVVAAVYDRVQLGMAPEDIQSIPGRTFEVPKCGICGESFHDADLIRQLPSCRHEFHSSCLVESLLRNSGADCPQCGKDIRLN